LDNVIFVLVPSFNPDGQIMITDWYNKNAGTPWEYSPLPELYHKYTGHDDNRDAFMNTQVESKLFNKLVFKDWFPVVYLDEHQMARTAESTPGAELTFEQMQRIDPRKPFAPPRDITPRTTYLRPWMGGKWTLRDIVDYELAATYGLLDAVASQRAMLQRNFY